MVVTKQNRQDFENAKRLFEGFSFTDIKVSVESGCFKKAEIVRIEEGYLEMNFASLKATFYIPAHATIGSVAEVYDENGNILGAYDFSKTDDIPSDVKDHIINDWFASSSSSDVIYKVQNEFDLRDFVKECIDEL